LKLTKDSVIGLIGMLVGSILFLSTQRIRDWHLDRLGTSFFPKVSAILIVLCSLMILLSSLKKNTLITASDRENSLSVKIELGFYSYVFIFISLILYVIVLPILGFVISSTMLMLFIYLFIVKEISMQNLLSGLGFSVLSTFILWYLFTKQLYVILP